MPGIVCTGGTDETGGDAGDGDAAGGAPAAGVWALTRRWGGHQSATLHTTTATTKRPPMMAHWMRARLDLPGRLKSLNVSNAAVLGLYVTTTRIAGRMP